MPEILDVIEIFAFNYEGLEGLDKTCIVEIKVLKKLSLSKILVGDVTGTCIMKKDPNFSGSDILTEEKSYQIHYDKSNIVEDTLVLKENVKILEKPWKVFVPVAIIAKANIPHDVELVSFFSCLFIHVFVNNFFLLCMFACIITGGGSKNR